MKNLTFYQYQLQNERHSREYEPDRELYSLANRIGSASRTIAKSLLKQMRNFSNAIYKSALRSREI